MYGLVEFFQFCLVHVRMYVFCIILCMQENSGFIAVLTKLYVVYGSYSSSMCPSICVEIVERMGDYFRAKGK